MVGHLKRVSRRQKQKPLEANGTAAVGHDVSGVQEEEEDKPLTEEMRRCDVPPLDLHVITNPPMSNVLHINAVVIFV